MRGQQLSCLSSGLRDVPFLFVPDHAVEDQEEFSHAGSEGHFLRFTRRAESLIEDTDHRVVPAGHKRGHIQRSPDPGSSAPNSPFAGECAAIAVEWRYPCKCGDLLPVELSKLREF